MNSDFVHINVDENNTVLHLLKSGDMFELNGITIEFSNGQFYEVYYEGYDYRHMCPKWVKTGKNYKMDEINELAKNK